jgi:hypothetical protein
VSLEVLVFLYHFVTVTHYVIIYNNNHIIELYLSVFSHDLYMLHVWAVWACLTFGVYPQRWFYGRDNDHEPWVLGLRGLGGCQGGTQGGR